MKKESKDKQGGSAITGNKVKDTKKEDEKKETNKNFDWLKD